MIKPFLHKTCIGILLILMIGFLIPQSFKMPVKNVTKESYSQHSFWYYPWGKSVTHKGVDILHQKNFNYFSYEWYSVIYWHY
jgi:hypothetical protein